MKPSRLPAFLRRALALAALTSLGSSPALAATWYWDNESATSGAQQGAGTWSNGGSTWWDGTATVGWNNSAGNIAHFGTDTGAGITATADASRTITVAGTVNAAGLVLNSNSLSSYILTGGEIALAEGSTIEVKGSDSTDTGTKRHRITSTILGNNIKISRQTTSTLAMLRLFGNNAWTGTLSLSATSGEGIFVEALNVGALNSLSTVSVGVNSSMVIASAAQPFTPAFSINGTGAGGNRGAIRFDSNGAILSGNVTLEGNAFINANSGVTATISGTINQGSNRTLTVNGSGGGIVILSANNNFTAPVTLSSGNLVLSGNNTIAGTIAVGANSLSLSGDNQFTGTGQITLNGGSLTLGRPSSVQAAGSVPNPIILTGNANTIVALVGAGGFSESEYAALPSMAVGGGGTAAYGMGALADFTWSGALSGTRAFAKSGPGTVTLLGTRSDSGGIQIREGPLRFYHIANGGQNSSIGSSSSAAASLVLSGGRLMYVGPEAQTDRLFTLSANSVIDSSGQGPLRFTNTSSIVASGANRNLTLTGYAPGENRIASVIPSSVSITKQGTAAWTLAGTNTHTGTTRNNGGLLTLDYSAGADPISTGPVLLNAGELRIKGAAAGTTETFTSFQLSTNQHTYGHLKFEGRVNLTVTTLTSGAQAQRSDLLDISGNLNNSLTVTALNANGAMKVVNGVLMVNASTPANGRAAIILRDKDGTYGFPTLSGETTGNLVKMSAATANSNIVTYTNGSTAALNDNTKNYRITKGEYSASGIWDAAGNYENLLFNTITLDSTAPTVAPENEISLFLNTGRFSPGSSGKGILITGNNNVTIANAEDFNSNTQPIWLHNHLEPNATLKLQADFDQQFLIFGGPGFTDHVGLFRTTDNFFLHGATVRLSRSQFLASTEGNFRVSAGGVLEVNADFFNLFLSPEWDEVDFIKGVRVTPAGGIAFYGDSGISAYSSNPNITRRVVHFAEADFGSNTPVSQNLTWGAGRFLTQPDSETDGDYTFKLSSNRSNVLLEFRNNIDLYGRSRNIEVANGSAPVDALLKGVLSGSDASGIIKSGAGTLQLGGLNTYKGETRIQEGTLIAGAGNLHSSSSISLITSASGGSGKLQVTSDLAVASVSIDGVAQPPGKVPPNVNITGAGSLYVGGILTPYQQWVSNNNLGSGESAGDFDADFDGVKNSIEYAVGTNPKGSTPSVLTQVPGSPAAVRFNRATTPARSDLGLFLESSPDLGTTWTVLATSTAGGAMASSVGASATVSESAGTVTVTDNRTQATGKVFYRLRAQIP